MKLRLEIDDLEPSFDDIAFLLFHTDQPGYAFAYSLNRLYDLDLRRIDDITLDDTPCPFYLHYDSTRHLHYFLVEPKGSTAFSPQDKLMLIKGESATEAAQYINADFSASAEPNPSDPLAKQHAELLDELLADFTVASLINLDEPVPSRKAARGHAHLQAYCMNILEYIDQHHLDY